MPDMTKQPACRIEATAESLAREADRAVLYGAILMAQRPTVRLKSTIAAAAMALLPAVQSFFAGNDDDEATYAQAYAQACGAEAFLLEKRAALHG
jgi:hypothetical protein